MAVPISTQTIFYTCMVVCKQDRAQKDYTSNPIPTSLFLLFYLLKAVPSKLIAELRRMSCLKNERCRDGVVTCVVLLCSVLLGHCHTCIKSSLCAFWHCYPYIPLHFLNIFLILVCALFFVIPQYPKVFLQASFKCQQTNQQPQQPSGTYERLGAGRKG